MSTTHMILPRAAGSPGAAKRGMAASAVALLVLGAGAAPGHAQTGVYTVTGATVSQTGQSYVATSPSQSAVYARNRARVTLTDCTYFKIGDAIDINASNQFGHNAGVLATTASTVTIVGGTLTTSASGANGLFATGAGTSVSMTGGSIHATGTCARGVDATYGGAVTLTNVDVTSTGPNSAALATDAGGGTVTVTGGTILASAATANSQSAGLYSTGTIAVTGATVSSAEDCGGVIDGASTIALTGTTLTGARHGVKIWQTAPVAGTASLTIDGGSLRATAGDGVCVTGETGNPAAATVAVENGATIEAGTGVLVRVLDGSSATFSAERVSLTGDLVADATSSLAATLHLATTLNGAVTHAAMSLDAGSTWIVSAASTVTALADADGLSGLTVTNIVGNGHDVRYDATLAANAYLGGLTYALVGGGALTPLPTPAQPSSWGAIKSLYR